MPQRVRASPMAGVTASIVSAVAIAIAISGYSLWPLAVVVWLLSAIVLAPFTGRALAVVGSFASLLACETLLLRLSPLFHIRLDLSSLMVWGVAAVVLLVVAIRAKSFVVPTRDAVRVAAVAAAAPLLGGFAVVVTAVASSSRVVGWSMRNDAAWTTISAQHIIKDGGIDTALHSNPSPLMSALMAVGASSGRAGLRGGAILESDVVRGGQLWVLIIICTSLFVGILVARNVDPSRPRLRALLAFVAGIIPFSWYASGFATYFGFYSASLAVLLLVSAWWLWRESAKHPFWALGFMFLLGTDVVATWALLVVVPIGLATLVIVQRRRELFSRGYAVRRVFLGLAAVQLILYIELFSLPDFLSQSGALADGGAIQAVPPAVFVALAAAMIASTAVLGRWQTGASPFLGAVVLVGCAGATLIALVASDHEAGWSYYPTKLAWLSTILFIVVLFESAAASPLFTGQRGRAIVSIAVASAVALVVTAIFVPPLPRSAAALNPFTAALVGTHQLDSDAAALFEIYRPGTKTLVSRRGPLQQDEFVNFWLLQATAPQSSTPIRTFAYDLIPTNAGEVCQAVEAWHGHVTVVTSRVGWARTLHRACPQLPFTVETEH